MVIDAQRGEFYLVTYEITATTIVEAGPLKIVATAEIESRLGAGGILTGPDVTRWFPDGKTLFPQAGTLAKLAADRIDFTTGEKLQPVYLRETSFVKSTGSPKT